MLDARRGLAGEALVARRDEDEARVLAAFDAADLRSHSGGAQRARRRRRCRRSCCDVESRPQRSRIASRDPRRKYLRAGRARALAAIAQDVTPAERDVAAQRWPVARRKSSRSLHRAGVTMLAGTDAPMPGVYPGYALHDELERLVDSGLSPAEALRAATLAPAPFLGIADDSGTVAVGQARRSRAARCGSAARHPQHAAHRRRRARWAAADTARHSMRCSPMRPSAKLRVHAFMPALAMRRNRPASAQMREQQRDVGADQECAPKTARIS